MHWAGIWTNDPRITGYFWPPRSTGYALLFSCQLTIHRHCVWFPKLSCTHIFIKNFRSASWPTMLLVLRHSWKEVKFVGKTWSTNWLKSTRNWHQRNKDQFTPKLKWCKILLTYRVRELHIAKLSSIYFNLIRFVSVIQLIGYQYLCRWQNLMS